MRKLFSEADIARDRLRMAMTAGKSAGWEWDLKSGRDYWFGDLSTMFGIHGDTSSGRVDDFFRYLHPVDRWHTLRALAAARRNRAAYKEEFRIVHQDGTVRWISATGSFYYSKKGHAERMLGMAVDITDHKRVEGDLRDSEEVFAKAFRESPMALTLTSAVDYRYLDVNTTFEQITGWKRQEVIGRTPFEINLWSDPAERQRFVERLQAEAPVRDWEVRFRRRDGSERIGLGSGDLIEIANEPCIISVFADVTERKQIEQKLYESEQRMSGIVDSAMDAIIAADENQNIVLFNAAAEKMFACNASEAVGSPISRFVPASARAQHEQHVRNFAASGITSRIMGKMATLYGLRANGQEFPLETSISQVTADGRKLFIAIIRDISERHRSEELLRTSADRLRLAVRAGRMYVDEWEISTGSITRSPECANVLGRDQPLQTTLEQSLLKIHPDDRPSLEHFAKSITREHPISQISYRFLRPDGTVTWLEKSAHGVFDESGKLLRTIGAIVDITERKQAEQSLLESEQRFRLVANTAPVMVWMSQADKLRSYFNQQWLDFTGRPLEAELGERWSENVHPDDVKACLHTYSQAFDKREAFDVQYRLRRRDGQYRWLYDRGIPRFNPDGSFAGYIGSCHDITDHKLAEETLRHLGRRLIEAHEQERTWIARELHDDISQRLALLTIELGRWSQEIPESAVGIAEHFVQARQQLFEISKDVQALSHRLHSSKLEYLGLAAATKSFCREFSDRHKVQIQFSHAEVPRDLPAEVSLALFRVMQEALQNAVKHSHADKFEVTLRGESGEVHVTISDPGTGFDPREAMAASGLGLISMRERLQLVGGILVVDSRKGRGTTIRARAPIPATGLSQLGAAG